MNIIRKLKSLSIKTYILLLIIIIIIISITAIAYLYELQIEHEDMSMYANNYHMTSRHYCSQIRKEIQQVIVHLNKKPFSDNYLRKIKSSFYIINKKLNGISALQHRFKDQQFSTTLNNVEKHFKHIYNQPYESFTDKNIHKVLLPSEIPQFMIHLNQLQQLHIIANKSLNIEMDEHKKEDTISFLIFLGITLTIGFTVIGRILSQITVTIDNQKQTNEFLKESEEKFYKLFSTSRDAIFIAEATTGMLVDANDAAVTLLSLPKDKIIGMHQTKLHPPKEVEYYADAFDEATHTEKASVDDLYIQRSNGEQIPVSISSSTFTLRGKTYIQGVFRDISERKQAEESLRLYTEKLKEKNRELQDFAHIASHDLQEPLRKVRAFGDRLSTKYSNSLGEQGQDYLNRMQNAASRMETLIYNLLSYSRIATKAEPFVQVDLTKVTQEVISDLEIRIEKTNGHLEIGNLPTIEADPTQMRQLLQNLIDNALKYFRKEQSPIVKIYGSLIKSKEFQTNNQLCQIIVEDNGIGFNEIYLDRIFHVFQRLHGRQEYEGTGLGLAICKKIVERHNGNITAKSNPGLGTIFIVTLPVKQSKQKENL